MNAEHSASGAVRTLRRLVRIPSPSGSEAAAAEYLTARMTQLGYAVRADKAGNVIGEVGAGAGPVIMLAGHIDTVPGEIPVVEHGGALYGRGTVDAKGPLCAMVHAGARAGQSAAAPFPYRVVVVGAVDEEGLSRGACQLAADFARPDALIIGEPSGVGCIVVGYKGLLSFDYLVRRPPAHTSSPSQKAAEVACDLWHALRDRLAAEYAGRSLFDQVVPTLIGIDGDLTEARARISCRTPRGFAPQPVLDWIRDQAADAEVRVIEQLPATRTSRADPLVRVLAAAVRGRVGQPSLKARLGTSDMNILAPHWSLPAVAYGPGDSTLDHTDHEHILIDEYLLAIDVLTDALPAIAQQAAMAIGADSQSTEGA